MFRYVLAASAVINDIIGLRGECLPYLVLHSSMSLTSRFQRLRLPRPYLLPPWGGVNSAYAIYSCIAVILSADG